MNDGGAELERLIRAAQSTAMNRHIKATSTVEVDMEVNRKAAGQFGEHGVHLQSTLMNSATVCVCVYVCVTAAA